MNYIKFSKFWSKKMSNIFVKYLCCHPSSKVMFLFQVLTNCLCDFRSYFLAWIYQHRWANQPRSGEGEHVCYGRFCMASYQFPKHFCPLCMINHFQSLGTGVKLTHHNWKFLFGPDEFPEIFSFKKTTTYWNIASCKKNTVGKYWLSKKFTIINNSFTIFWYLPH
jgi:hypothetical protein